MALWIESQVTIGAHPKTKKLARHLEVSVPTAVGHLHLLWHFAVEYARDGDLSKHDPEDVAIAAGWDGDPQVFLEELRGCGWLDDDLSVHDWADYAGRLIEQQERDAERKRKWREQRRGRDADAGGDATGTGKDAARDGGRTQPNNTSPDLTPPTTTPAEIENVRLKLIEDGFRTEVVEKTITQITDQIATGTVIKQPLAYARKASKAMAEEFEGRAECLGCKNVRALVEPEGLCSECVMERTG